MKKIPSLYLRDPETDLRYVSREINPAAAWVLDPESGAKATVKWDGTCVLHDAHGQWWTRHQVKPGKQVPGIYHPVETDPVTGRTQGWIPAETSQYVRYLKEAITAFRTNPDIDPWLGFELGATYELCGPKVGANPHGFEKHKLIRHGNIGLTDVPTGYDELAEYLRRVNQHWYLEGVVWHAEDGRMAKIKTRDFRDE